MKVIFHYALAVLEGGLSGVCFYRAGRSEDKKYRAIMYTASALCFAASVIDSIVGGRELRNAKTREINGGNDNA